MKIPLKTRLTKKMLHTTEERLRLLEEIGITTVGDFLQYFPREYEDYTTPVEMHEVRSDTKNFLQGKFIRLWKEQTMRQKTLIKALFETESGEQAECVWFGNPRIATQLPLQKKVFLLGKADLYMGKVTLKNPEFELLGKEAKHAGRIRPVYREHGALRAAWFRDKVYEMLESTASFPTLIPGELIQKEGLLQKQAVVEELHFPTDQERLEKAKKSLSFERIFFLQLLALIKKQKWQETSEEVVEGIPLNPKLMKDFFASLPFTPTNAQKIALFEILRDFEKPFPMLRLLEGDVGSGKTLVAVGAALPILRAGGQAAFLAPTEVLAKQHFAGVQKMFQEFDPSITVASLTGSTSAKERKTLLEDLRKGKIHVLIGTHALLEESVIFHHLRFVVVDEQHRFGVMQRERLIEKGTPHVLQMTATPIPRTLAMTAFGDQDFSVLNELPPGRKKIHTKVVPPGGRTQIERFIESEVEKGRQAFIICPLVEESEKLEVKSATEEYERLQHIFPKLSLGLLHGQMRPKDKDQIMKDFAAKKFDLLVSTAVVEVGVDIPNASVILIEGAERFGLAQLHQFRGRVGRGAHQSYCFLFPTNHVTERLRAMEREHCGFQLAEIDFQIRGGGDLYGTQQSGLFDQKFPLTFDVHFIAHVREVAQDYLAEKGQTFCEELLGKTPYSTGADFWT